MKYKQKYIALKKTQVGGTVVTFEELKTKLSNTLPNLKISDKKGMILKLIDILQDYNISFVNIDKAYDESNISKLKKYIPSKKCINILNDLLNMLFNENSYDILKLNDDQKIVH